MGKRILIVLTSQDTLGDSKQKTGWYLPELAHPLKALFDAGYTETVDIVSPKGGVAPVVRSLASSSVRIVSLFSTVLCYTSGLLILFHRHLLRIHGSRLGIGQYGVRIIFFKEYKEN